MKYHVFHSVVKPLALSSVILFLVAPAQSQEPALAEVDQPAAEGQKDFTPELMRSFLHLQEQMHSTQLAVERARLESDAAAAKNSEALNARLKFLEEALAAASQDDRARTDAILESNSQIRQSNSNMMLLGVLLVLIIAGALGFAAWLQWRTVSQLASLPASVGFPAMPAQGYPALGSGSPLAQIGSTRLMEALDKLEHRIADIEGNSHANRPLSSAPTSHARPAASIEVASAPIEATGELGDLIREGEELLAREESEKAIEHFDSILRKHPGNPEVLLRKGTALERLHRDLEAIECYDLAIRADNTMTMAYLHKGGLFNRMERFSEAMECYEQALRVQENRRTV